MSYSIVRKCPSCGKANRIPAGHLADTGRCGSCKAALPPVAKPLEVDTPAFDEIIRESRVPVFVDFWAPWCGPCRISAPEVEALARELAGKALVLKVNADQSPELAARLGVETIPNFFVFQNGRPVLKRAGAVPRSQMRRWFEQVAA